MCEARTWAGNQMGINQSINQSQSIYGIWKLGITTFRSQRKKKRIRKERRTKMGAICLDLLCTMLPVPGCAALSGLATLLGWVWYGGIGM